MPVNGGMIYTFYSYKGGVGRSMALSNLGALFFRQGYTVLMVDWDLEAPGLDRYFLDRYEDKLRDTDSLPGVVDLIKDYVNRVAEAPDDDEDRLPVPDLNDYIIELDGRGDCRLLFLGAGARSDGELWQGYAEFVQDFDWSDFYRDWEGGAFFEWLRTQFKSRADVVLIDSRTGVTEMGGVTTQHLGDVVVLLCGSNMENVVNTSRMAQNFTNPAVREARGHRDLDVIVVPSRIDGSDLTRYGEFLSLLDKEFGWLDDSIRPEASLPRELILHYVPAFSYRETLIIGDTEAERVAERLVEEYWHVHKDMRALALEGTTLRLGWPRVLDRKDTPVVYLAYCREGARHAIAIADHLKAAEIETRHVDPGNRVSEHDIAIDMERAHVVVVLGTRGINHSRSMTQVIAIAEDLGKPIIPILFDDDAKIPLALSAIRSINMQLSIAHFMAELIRSIRVLGGFDPDPVNTKEPLIYLCYDAKDASEDGRRVASFLDRHGFRTWRAVDEILPGMIENTQVEKALGRAQALVALVTPSLVKDASFIKECAFATHIKTKIIPVLLQPTPTLTHPIFGLEPINAMSHFSLGLNLILKRLRYFGDGI